MNTWIFFQVIKLVWPALLLSGVLIILSQLPRLKAKSPRPSALGGMYMGPVFLLTFAALMYGRFENSSRTFNWVFIGCLGFMALIPILFFLLRERHVQWQWRLVLIMHALLTTAVTLVSWFVSVMALTNDWL